MEAELDISLSEDEEETAQNQEQQRRQQAQLRAQLEQLLKEPLLPEGLYRAGITTNDLLRLSQAESGTKAIDDALGKKERTPHARPLPQSKGRGKGKGRQGKPFRH